MHVECVVCPYREQIFFHHLDGISDMDIVQEHRHEVRFLDFYTAIPLNDSVTSWCSCVG